LGRGRGFLGSRWFAPAATGVAGLILGVVVGAVGVGLVSAVWHHGSQFGDDRGQHWQYERRAPR
jgi:hypothetical protein